MLYEVITVSKVTEAVIDQVVAWQNRPLDEIYPVVYLDCIVIKVHQDVITSYSIHYTKLYDVFGMLRDHRPE